MAYLQLAVLVNFILLGCWMNNANAFIIQHYGPATVDVTLNVQFESSCSSASNFSSVVSVPTGSSLLNVLENANSQLFPTMLRFRVLYLQNSSYHVSSINDIGDGSGSCSWTFFTNPATLSPPELSLPALPISKVFVTNNGMTVTFLYYTSTSVKPETLNTVHPVLPELKIGPPATVQYDVEHVSPCQSSAGVGIPSTPQTVSFTLGESALNVMEAAANLDPTRTFVVTNTFGSFYTIHTIGSMSVNGTCTWCSYFAPSPGTEYQLTADVRNFIVPISGGNLTMKFETSCGSTSGTSYDERTFLKLLHDEL